MAAERAGWRTLGLGLLGLAAPLAVAVVVMAAADAPATRPAPPAPERARIATRPAGEVLPLQRAANPHWTQTGCHHCHGGDTEAEIPVERVEAICVKCHDGRHARPEPHPVGRPATEATPAPRGWPTPGGRVTCITCHLIHPGGNPHQPRPQANPQFLRGYTGNLLAFCGRCHTGYDPQESSARGSGRYNPHLVMLSPQGQLVASSCSFCHNQPVPAGAEAVRTGDARLRSDGITLCIGCHDTHLDWFTPGHMGAKATPQVLGALAAGAAARTSPPDSKGQAAATRPALEPILPLGGPQGDTLVCGTCHNPHQKGVFPAGSVLDAGAMRARQPAEQLRGLGKDICGACHAK